MFRELLSCFDTIDDPRQRNKTEHKLVDILAITVCAVLTHAESFEDIALYGRLKEKWLRQFLELPGGLPSHDTIRRVFMLIDARQFEACFLAWTRQVFPQNQDTEGINQIAVDGKTLRRSFDRRQGLSPLHVVSAFATRSGLTLAQKVVGDKKGEAELLPALLEGLELTGALISLDALYARKDIAATIVERRADYLIALKGNQKKDYIAVSQYFDTAAFSKGMLLRPIFDAFDDRHGRLTRRRAFVTTEPKLLNSLGGWTGLTQIIAVETITCQNHVHGGERGKITSDIRYFLTSAVMSGQALAAAVRNHWSIENSLHWVLDIGFREDECRVRDRNAASNLSAIRKIAINLVKADSSVKGSIKGKRKAAGWDNDFMQKIIAL